MLSSTFPYIFNTAPLPPGKTYGEDDVVPSPSKAKETQDEVLEAAVTLPATTKLTTDVNEDVVDTGSETDEGDSLNVSSSGHNCSFCGKYR